MSTSAWLRHIQRQLFVFRPASARQRRRQKTLPARRTARPRLEALEDRITPTVFTPTVFTDGTSGGTLREAVINANADAGAATDTIQLSAGTYTLNIANVASNHDVSSSQGDLNITSTAHTLIIQGTTDASGHPTSVIDQTAADRVFQIVNPGTTVIFQNVIIEGGNAQDDGTAGAVAGASSARGGGILDNGGNVTLNNVVVRSNQATAGTGQFGQGGGVFASAGALTLNNSVIQNNKATGGAGGGGAAGFTASGGGVCYLSAGTLSVTNSTVANNTAQGGVGDNAMSTDGGGANGGGIYSLADTTILTASTLSSNSVKGGTGGAGGGVDGAGSGGGAYLEGLVTITNATIALNTATGVGAAGGGVYFGKAGHGQLTNVTVTANQANNSTGTPEGGGLDNNNGDIKDVTLVNTVVAGNTLNSLTSVANVDVRGQFVSGGHNVIGVADGVNDPGFTLPGDQAGSVASPLNAKLGTLQNNGGPTQTILPLAGSPVLGAGFPASAPSTDQRGVARPAGGPTDSGAVQVSGVPVSPPPAPPPSPPPSSSPPPSLFQAIIGLYIDEVEKDLHIGDPAALQQNINFLSQFTVIFGINIAGLIEQIADANVQAALSGHS